MNNKDHTPFDIETKLQEVDRDISLIESDILGSMKRFGILNSSSDTSTTKRKSIDDLSPAAQRRIAALWDSLDDEIKDFEDSIDFYQKQKKEDL